MQNNPQTAREELSEKLATAIWSVHRSNPRDEILDEVLELIDAYTADEVRRAEKDLAYDLLALPEWNVLDGRVKEIKQLRDALWRKGLENERL